MLKEVFPRPYLHIELAYGTSENFTKQKIYTHPKCYLHQKAYECFEHVLDSVQSLGLGIKIFDAFRPIEAQQKLWEICPNPMYVADPQRGSPHSRGIALDVTLMNLEGEGLDMGTSFDNFTLESHHFSKTISKESQRNRFLLIGLMNAAGFDWYKNEWWHYQLPQAPEYPLLYDNQAPMPLMGSS